MRVVFFGDSLTEGIDGASYLRVLEQRVRHDPALGGFDLVNAGVGGDTVVNLLRRVDDAVALMPDWVVIFIGGNDCTTQLIQHVPLPFAYYSRRYFRDVKGVRGPITLPRYRDGLRMLVDALRARTSARLALCTPTTIGESPGSRAWRVVDAYADVVRFVASERSCDVIDLRAAFAGAIRALPARSTLAPLLSLRARSLPRDDIEALARARGYRLVYDGIHLTQAGAELAAATVERWLVGLAAQPPGDVVECVTSPPGDAPRSANL